MSFIGIGSPIPEIANLPGQGGAIEVLLDYSSSAVCNDAATQSPSQAEPAGGVFSASPSGLNINTSTGVITPTGSTPNTYTITYTVSGESSSFTFTINPIQQSTFSYSSSSLEQYGTASPIFASGTTTGGTFSATSGLVINTTTGVLDLANSTIGGPYTVTYTTPGPCATSSTFNVSVTALSTSLVDNNFAIEFDAGSSEYIDGGSASYLNGLSNFSFSSWVKISTLGSDDVIASDWSYSATASLNKGHYTLAQGANNGSAAKIRLFIKNAGADGGNSLINTNDFILSPGEWYHILFTYNSGTIVMYVNNIPYSFTTTGTIPSSLPNEESNLNIGRWQNIGRYWDGDIDEVAIWNRALEAADVQRIYNGSSTSGKAANLFSTGLSNGLVYWNRMGD